jgi:hypothetical protein
MAATAASRFRAFGAGEPAMQDRAFRGALGAVVLAVGVHVHAGTLTIAPNGDVLAGRAGFLAAGTTTVQFDWSTQFAPNAHTTGVLAPWFSLPGSLSVTLPDSTVNTITGVNNSTLALGNWVDAPGFNGPTNAATADLALNSVESFDLEFGSGHRSVGFAIITGTGNTNEPGDIDLNGATFTITARDAANNLIDSGTFALPAGAPASRWLTITSDVPFRKLEIREIGAASLADQYFSNIHTSVEAVSVVPLPAAAWMGLALLAATVAPVIRRRRRAS